MDIFGILIVGGLVGAGGLVSYFVGKGLSGGWLVGLWGVLGLVALTLVAMATNATGWDGLAYMIFLIFGCAPVGVGMLGGSILGRVKRNEA